MSENVNLSTDEYGRTHVTVDDVLMGYYYWDQLSKAYLAVRVGPGHDKMTTAPSMFAARRFVTTEG